MWIFIIISFVFKLRNLCRANISTLLIVQLKYLHSINNFLISLKTPFRIKSRIHHKLFTPTYPFWA